MTEIDYTHTENIVCPYCGHEDRDSNEVEFDGLEGEAEVDCGECCELFLVTRNVTVSYSSNKKE